MPYTAGPFDASSLYIQWGGALPGGETFSCGLRVAPSSGTAIAYSDSILTGVSAAVLAWHKNLLTSPRALLQFCKVNAIDPSGHYVDGVTHEHVFANIPGMGVDAITPANQVALAVSTITGVSRGPAHRGRFYMPLPTVVLAADGEILATDGDYIKAQAVTFIAALNAAQPGGQVVAVMSRKAGAPAHRAVTGIEVGRVLDTQRRRRRSLAENYR